MASFDNIHSYFSCRYHSENHTLEYCYCHIAAYSVLLFYPSRLSNDLEKFVPVVVLSAALDGLIHLSLVVTFAVLHRVIALAIHPCSNASDFRGS